MAQGAALALLLSGCSRCGDDLVIEHVMDEALRHAGEPAAVDLPLPASGGGPTTASGATAEPAPDKPTALLPYEALDLAGRGDVLVISRDGEDGGSELLSWTAGAEPTVLSVHTAHRVEILGLVRDHVYYRRRPQSDPDLVLPAPIMRAPLRGGESELVLEDSTQHTHVAAVGDWVYLATGGGPNIHAGPSWIEGHNTATGQKILVRGGRGNTVAALVVHRGHLYWTSHDQPERAMDHQPGHLWRIPLGADGSPSGDEERLHSSADRPSDLASDGEELYILTSGTPERGFEDGSLSRWEADAAAAIALVRDVSMPDSLVWAGGQLCWRAMGNWTLYCYSPRTDRLTRMASVKDDEQTIWDPTSFDGKLVWTVHTYSSSNSGAILGAPLPGD
jgi:hypothetical protein